MLKKMDGQVHVFLYGHVFGRYKGMSAVGEGVCFKGKGSVIVNSCDNVNTGYDVPGSVRVNGCMVVKPFLCYVAFKRRISSASAPVYFRNRIRGAGSSGVIVKSSI